MGQSTESSETCADRPTEVSVIRFVSRNHTIEEIAPKKEVYVCKSQGCGKVFTNQDEFKSHEALESLKIRFICREPGCGEELADPGSMWRHYQEWHSNEASVHVCPYSSCGTVHATADNLEDHIESCHRHLPAMTAEPEVICYEGNTPSEHCLELDDNVSRSSEDVSNSLQVIRRAQQTEFPKNKDLLITEENFLAKSYDNCKKEIEEQRSQPPPPKIIFLNNDVTITKQVNNHSQEHRIDLVNLEKAFRSGLEGEPIPKVEVAKSNGSTQGSDGDDDEEYTPKKQRMSRNKLGPYKCTFAGCGKIYRYISNFRHHQDTHKLPPTVTCNNSEENDVDESQTKPKSLTISFFICKMPGCGAQVSNVSGLWKHYQDNHASSKLPAQVLKGTEIYRCKLTNCNAQFSTTSQLYKHFNEVHKNNVVINGNGNENTAKAANGEGGNSINNCHQLYQPDTTTPQRITFKTDLNAKHRAINDFDMKNDKQTISIIKEEINCGD